MAGALLGVWLFGGVSWGERVLLRHGADPRRAAILLVLGMACLWPRYRREGWGPRAAVFVWEWLKTSRGRWTAWSVGLGATVVLGVLQAMALHSNLWDVGIYHQVIWAVANGHGFWSSISGAGHYLMDHVSLSYALLAPFFWLTGSSPLMLPILHPVLVYVGIAAWIWLAEQLEGIRTGGKRKGVQPAGAGALAAATTVFGLSFQSLWGNLHWGFHESAIVFAALSWAFAWRVVLPGWRWATVGMFLVAAASKELILVDVAFALGVYAWQERKARPRFAGVVAALAVGLLGAFLVFESLPHPADKNYFVRYYGYLGQGMGDFFKTLLLRPWVVVQTIGAWELVRYAGMVLVPWLAIPVWLAWRVARREQAWLLAILPSVASAALSTDRSLRGASFHYAMELWPVLAVVTLVSLARYGARNAAQLEGDARPAAVVATPVARRWAVAWALLALVAWDRDPVGDARKWAREAVLQTPIRRAFAGIPADVRVSADDAVGPWLANRKWLVRFAEHAYMYEGKCPELLVLRAAADVDRVRTVCAGSKYTAIPIQDWVLLRSR